MSCGFAPTQALAASGRSLHETGLHQLEARNFTGALVSFRQAAEAFSDRERSAVAIYNAGLASFEQARADEVLDPLSSQTYYRQASSSFRAALELKPGWEAARWNLELALQRLSLINREIEEQQKDQQEASDESEEAQPETKPSQEGEEEEEGEWEETEEEGANQPSDQMSGENAMNLEARDIPPPVVEPEDIFQQERENNAARRKNSQANYQPVEKDW